PAPPAPGQRLTSRLVPRLASGLASRHAVRRAGPILTRAAWLTGDVWPTLVWPTLVWRLTLVVRLTLVARAAPIVIPVTRPVRLVLARPASLAAPVFARSIAFPVT
ncbi:MAG: hypothetical protein ACRDYC_10585, partial [Acidimicrobiales bacterium]